MNECARRLLQTALRGSEIATEDDRSQQINSQLSGELVSTYTHLPLSMDDFLVTLFPPPARGNAALCHLEPDWCDWNDFTIIQDMDSSLYRQPGYCGCQWRFN